MFVTNGNRKPKPGLKVYLLREFCSNLTMKKILSGDDPSSRRFRGFGRLHDATKDTVKQIQSFAKENKGKIVFAMFGNYSDGFRVVSLYALPSESIEKITYDRGDDTKSPTIILKKGYIFDDELVGIEQAVTLLSDDKGNIQAFQSAEEAEEIYEESGFSLVKLGRHPYKMIDGKAYIGINVEKWSTQREYKKRKKAANPPSIPLMIGPSPSGMTFDALLYGKEGNKSSYPLSTHFPLDDLEDGCYLASLEDEGYHWLVKTSNQIGKLTLTQYYVFEYDSAEAAAMEKTDLPEG